MNAAPDIKTTSDLLEQDEWWRQRDKTWIRVVDMTAIHARRAHAMMLRAAPRLHHGIALWTLALGNPFSDYTEAYAMTEAEIDALVVADPAEWLAGQPLLQALADRAGL